MFDNIYIFFLNREQEITQNFLFDYKKEINRRASQVFFYFLDELSIDSKTVLDIFPTASVQPISKIEVENFEFPESGACYVPYLGRDDLWMNSKSVFRSDYLVKSAEYLMVKALEKGVWILKEEADFNQYLNFNEKYHDVDASPIKGKIIFGQIEYPIIKHTNPFKTYMGYGSRIFARSVISHWSGDFKIGRGSHIGADCEIFVTGSFEIEQFSIISSGFKAVDNAHTIEAIMTYNLGNGPYGFLGKVADPRGNTHIGSDVWIGMNVSLLNGVKIGHGSVVATGSVVTKDVEPYTIVAGIPAKQIGIRFDKEVVDFLLEVKWWDWPMDKLYQQKDFLLEVIKGKDIHEVKRIFKERIMQ